MNTNRTASVHLTTAALLVAVVVLASSTIYLALRPTLGNSASPSSTRGSGAVTVGGVTPLASGPDAQAGSASSQGNSITVSGTGQVSYIPNEALVTVSVVTQNKTAEAATSSNAATTTSVIKALNGAGISNSSIQTMGYSLSVNYANCYSNCVPQITGYTVTNNLQVNFTSSSPNQLGLKAGSVIDTAVAAGANQISLTFSETNYALSKLTNSALQQAVASASAQAQVIASSLGVSITGVISASQGVSYTPQYYGNMVTFAATTTVLAGPATPIIPGTQSMSVSVQVVYAIS